MLQITVFKESAQNLEYFVGIRVRREAVWVSYRWCRRWGRWVGWVCVAIQMGVLRWGWLVAAGFLTWFAASCTSVRWWWWWNCGFLLFVSGRLTTTGCAWLEQTGPARFASITRCVGGWAVRCCYIGLFAFIFIWIVGFHWVNIFFYVSWLIF